MNKRILLADDSLTIQKVVELTFMDESFDVVAVGSGDEAIASLETELPEILIADVHMPGPSGYEVCRSAKAMDASLPVLLLIGTFETLDEDEMVTCGADDHLKKPFDSQELLQVVRKMTSEPRADLSASADDAPAAGFDLGAAPEITPAPGEVDAGDEDSEESIAPDETGEAEGMAETSDEEIDLSAFQEISLDDEAEEIPLVSAEPSDEVELSRERTTDWELASYMAPSPEAPPLTSETPETETPESETSEMETPDPMESEPAFEATAFDMLLSETPSAGEGAVEESSVGAESFESASAEPEPPTPEPEATHEDPGVSRFSDEDVERVARRVAEILADDTIRDVAWDVIPDMAEIVIKDRIRELEAEAEAE